MHSKISPQVLQIMKQRRSCRDAINCSCFFYMSCQIKFTFCQVMNSPSTYNGSLTNHVSNCNLSQIQKLHPKRFFFIMLHPHLWPGKSPKSISASINRRFACAQSWTHTKYILFMTTSLNNAARLIPSSLGGVTISLCRHLRCTKYVQTAGNFREDNN